MNARLPARSLDGNRHGALERLAAPRNQTLGVGRTSQAEEEGRAHVDEDDPPEHLSDGQRNRDTGVLGLRSCDSDGFASSIERTAEDEDGGDAPEAVPGESVVWIMPVFESDGGDAVEATCGVDDGKNEEGN